MAGREFERRQPGTKVKASGGLVVLLGIPEGAIIRGINSHTAVVAPAVEAVCLDPGTRNNHFRGFHLAQRVGWNAAHILDARFDGAARLAVAEGNVSGLVHGDASHPERNWARATTHRALLEHPGGRPWAAHFVPT